MQGQMESSDFSATCGVQLRPSSLGLIYLPNSSGISDLDLCAVSYVAPAAKKL